MTTQLRDRWHRHSAALSPLASRLSRAESSRDEPLDALPDRGFLRHHGLTMLWAAHHARLSDPQIPAAWLQPHEAVSARLYAQVQRRALERIACVWEPAGIPWLVMKSLGYRDELYEAPELRPSTDIDLLVLPADRGRALALLEACAARRLDPGSAHECTLRLDTIDIDLHWDLLAPGRLPASLAPSIMERRVRKGVFYRPDDTDALMIALVHPAFAKHVCSEHMGLNRVADLLLMLDRFDVDEERLVAQLRSAGVSTAAWAVLAWTDMIAPARPLLLRHLLSRLAPGALRRRYIMAWLRNDWPGRLMSRAPWLTAAALLTVLHDRPSHAARAGWRRLSRRSPA